jgi:hypothetical protein
MGRRTGSKAEMAVKDAREARWRYLLRNPAFRADLQRVLDVARPKGLTPTTVPYEAHRAFTGLREAWEFTGVSLKALHDAPDPSSDNLGHYEALFDREEPESPVEAIYDQDGETYLSAAELGDPRILYLALDLAHPRDVLVSLADSRVREAQAERSGSIKRDPRKRRRLDRVDFYLDVYDRAAKGEAFSRIALALGKRPSTVKSAFLAAARNIFGADQARPSKADVPLVGFDPDRHMTTCAVCKRAESVASLCPAARAYAGQDYSSQRETTVKDVEEAEAQHRMRSTGRKAPARRAS